MDTNGNGHSKNYQVPKADHPWRRYKNRTTPFTEEEVAEQKALPSLLHFLKDIVDNWDTYTIEEEDNLVMGNNYAKMKNVAPQRQAEWLADFIRKTWVKKSYHPEYV
jgi:hypothetical protein